MGQSSSQPQQTQDTLRPHKATSSPTSLPNRVRARKRPHLNAEEKDDDSRQAKRTKPRTHDATTKERKPRRSMPQHRCGTFILPEEELNEEGSCERKTSKDDPQLSPGHGGPPSLHRQSTRQQRESVERRHNACSKTVIEKEEAANGRLVTQETSPRGNARPGKKTRTRLAQNAIKPKEIADTHFEETAASVDSADYFRRPKAGNEHTAPEIKQSLLEKSMPDMDKDVEFKTTYENELDLAKRAALTGGIDDLFSLQAADEVVQSHRQAMSDRALETVPKRKRKDKKSKQEQEARKASKKTLDGPKPNRNTEQATCGAHQLPPTLAATQPGFATTAATINPPRMIPRQSQGMPTPRLSQDKVAGKAAEATGLVAVGAADVSIAADEGRSEHEDDYDPRIREGYVDASEQIKDWPSSQVSPGPRDHVPSYFGSPKETAKRPTARKSCERSDNNDEYQETAALSNAESLANDKSVQKTNKTKHNASRSSVKQKSAANTEIQGTIRGSVIGTWSEDEIAFADSVFASCCNLDNISAHQMKCNIVDWKEAGVFREEIQEAFPFRSKAAIRKFCQRRYHPYQTGSWTKEEDEILKTKVATSGKDWVNVGEFVGRTGQACKDRWTKIVQYEATLRRGPWTVEEEQRLVKAVQDLLETLKAEREDAGIENDMESLDMMIDWEKVAKMLEGSRSAKRCLEKWKAIGRRIAATKDSILQQSIEESQHQQLSDKQKALDAAYSELGWQDELDALCEIVNVCAEVPGMGFPHESTLWSVVSSMVPESKFPPKLRRKCYLELLEKFGSLPTVQQAEGIGAKASAMKDHLRKMQKSGRMKFKQTLSDTPYKRPAKPPAPPTKKSKEHLVLAQTADPAKDKSEKSIARPPRALKGYGTSKSKKKHLSRERIENSDDED